MTWNISWEGRATDFEPGLLKALGKPGRMAQTARDALWEAVQKVGEHDASSWVQVRGHGWENLASPGLGQMTITVGVVEEPGEIAQKIQDQQPVDLRTGDST